MECTMIIMTLWRIWHVRNEVVHHKPAPPVDSSKRFLCSYIESILTIKQYPQADTTKGKMVVDMSSTLPSFRPQPSPPRPARPKQWTKPPDSVLKLNVDGSYDADLGCGGAGMVLRDGTGAIIFSACRFLESCLGPLEAELVACREGVTEVLRQTNRQCIVETDCPEALNLIMQPNIDRSACTFLVQEIKDLRRGQNLQFVAIHRDQNSVSHVLANLGRTTRRHMTWLESGPDDVLALCRLEAVP